MNILLAWLMISSVFAADKVFRIKDQSVIVSIENGIMANRDCLKKKSTCKAYKQARLFAGIKVEGNGKNPYAEKCKQLLKGEVVIGFDEKGNENSFCFFPDKSVISCSSLEKLSH